MKLARRDHWRREKLQSLVAHFRQQAAFRDLQLLPSTTPVQPVMCGDEKRAVALSTALEAQGYWVPAIRPPTVPDGRARLRVTLSSLHTQGEVDALIDALCWARDAVEMGFGHSGAGGACARWGWSWTAVWTTPRAFRSGSRWPGCISIPLSLIHI